MDKKIILFLCISATLYHDIDMIFIDPKGSIKCLSMKPGPAVRDEAGERRAETHLDLSMPACPETQSPEPHLLDTREFSGRLLMPYSNTV